jgi:hypothetical protein
MLKSSLLCLSAIIIALMVLFPPWRKVIPEMKLGNEVSYPRRLFSLGYSPIFDPPSITIRELTNSDRRLETQDTFSYFDRMSLGDDLLTAPVETVRERAKMRNEETELAAAMDRRASVEVDLLRLSIQVVGTGLVLILSIGAIQVTDSRAA